ncbi:uncharacterized protein A4U43_C03F10650 [Asparagus officinalis]|uniref:Uncharacterized protein n=1 Tax=Asparagus officinalis TaxID=4686 RepID=A0A5P1F8X5_ASPOF|nr:uncharacterized protein A4U43_C03F10650 [Asparagus officinalis]
MVKTRASSERSLLSTSSSSSTVFKPKRSKVDLRGDLFGMLNAHPLAPPVSLHHLDTVDPLYPGKNRLEGLKHLFEAIDADPGIVFQ